MGVVLVFFTGVLLRFSIWGLWAGLVGVTILGSFLASGLGNFFLLGWTFFESHTSGVVTIHPTTYYLGSHLGGTPAGDFKFLLLVLFAVAGICFLHGVRLGYEPLLIGLISVVAGLVTFSVDNLVLLYLVLELQALCLYTLVGFYKFDEERVDSAMRYLLTGSLVSGFMLLGFARGYGLNGTFQVFEFNVMDRVGSAWILGVLLFKVGTAPFHFWTPTVYSPLEWGTLGVVLGTAKVNAWYLLAVNLSPVLSSSWWPAWWAGFLSVVVGSVGGYFQSGVAPLLAYSGVINGGYLLLLALAGRAGSFSFGYYAGVYLLGTMVLVGVLSVFGDTRVSSLTPWNKLGVAVPFLLYYLALNVGGLPVFPGFFAKLTLLAGITEFGVTLLVVVVAASVVPAVYYVSLAAAPLFGYSEQEGVVPVALTPVVVVPVVLGLNGLTSLVVGVA